MDKKQKTRWFIQLPFLLALLLGTIFIIHQQHSTPYQHNTGYVFGTVYHITYQYDKDLSKEIMAQLKEVDTSLSMFNKQSVITQVNNNADIAVNDMFAEVFTLAEKISADTDGAFDITVAPLVNAWGFGFKSGQMPTKAAIDSIRAYVGFHKVSMDKDRHIHKADPRLMLDCSAIAKGFGCDKVAELMRRKGIANFMVEIGGEVVTCGISEKRVPWKIGVTRPTDDSLNVNQEIQAVLNVTDRAMATSGNYRNFYFKDGKKYAHTINPHTGYPVQHSLLSATVLANHCATADAYATSFMVMGIEKAKAVLRRNPQLMAYFIYADKDGKYQVWYSPSMKGKILE